MIKKTFKGTKCSNHIEREAVARCPRCKKDYCRECVTEYKEEMLCINCLSLIPDKKKSKSSFLGSLFLLFLFAISFLITTSIFYLIGEMFSGADTFHNQKSLEWENN